MTEMEWENPGLKYITQALEEFGIDANAAIPAFGQASIAGDILKGQNELVDRVMERALALRDAEEER